MPKVSVKVGVTMQIGESAYEYARFDIGIDDIDTGQDLFEQLRAAREAYEPTMELAQTLLDKKIERELKR